MSANSNLASFAVPEDLLPYRQETIDRLAYLFPKIKFTAYKTRIECSSDGILDEAKLNEEIRYGLVRSKVRAEGQANRLALYAAVFAR